MCYLKEGKQGQVNNNINDKNNNARKYFIQCKHQIMLEGMQGNAERNTEKGLSTGANFSLSLKYISYTDPNTLTKLYKIQVPYQKFR